MLVRTWAHPMMDQHHDYYGERSYAAVNPRGNPPVKKREKSSRVGSVLRKLLGRKEDSSQLLGAVPVSPRHEGSKELFALANGRTSRSRSLPADRASKARALRSHAPFGPDPIDLRDGNETRVSLAIAVSKRRLSLPDVAPLATEAFTEQSVAKVTTSFDGEDIGYAITSGGKLRRRSRSVDASTNLEKHSTSSEPTVSRSRDDEVQSWRDSVDPGQSTSAEYGTNSPHCQSKEQREDSGFYNSEVGTIEAAMSSKEPRERTNYQSYDFQQMATAINEQEQIPIEQRMMIAEVKLMDLEYAISKLQDHAGSPPSVNIATPRAIQGLSLTTTGLSAQTPRNRIASAVAKLAPGSSSAGGAADSRRTTALSISTAAGDNNSVDTETRARHVSIETSIHQPEGPPRTATSSETPPSAVRTSVQRPLSLTSISIEHFTTLITLLKREQHARIRLEDELAELRREVFHVLHPSPGPVESLLATSSPTSPSPRPPPPLSARSASGGSLYRQRRWDGSRRGMVRIDDFHVAHRRPSYEGEGSDFTGGEFLTLNAPPDVYRATTAVAAAEAKDEDDPPRGRPRQSHESAFDDSDSDSDDSDAETETETSEYYVTPIETSGRFEAAARMWGRDEGTIF